MSRPTGRSPALAPALALALGLGTLTGSAGCGGSPALTVSWDPAQVEQQLPEVVAELRRNQPQRALDLLDQLAEAKALPEGASHFRALALQDLGRAQEAEAAWRAELEQHPGNGRAHALLAQILIDQGQLDEAATHLEAARVHAPDFAFVQLLSGRLALQQDDDERAQRAFRDFLLLDPYGPQAAEAHHALSLVFARRGPAGAADAAAHEQASQALEQVYGFLASYERRLAENPDDLDAADGVSRAYLSLYQNFAGDRRLLEKVEPALLYILQRKPDHAKALYNLGFVRAEQKRLPEAMELFRQSIAADPQAAAPRINLGRALLVLGRTDEAVHELELALQVATTDEERARTELELGQAKESRGGPEDLTAAIAHYQTVLALYPDDPLHVAAQIERLKALGAAPPDAPPDAPSPGTPPPAAPPAAEPPR